MTKTFIIKGEWSTRTIWLNGKELRPGKSQKIINHSPDGFSWGYGGSGPAQLALAIMLEIFGHAEGYQTFKWDVVTKLPTQDFAQTITWDDQMGIVK